MSDIEKIQILHSLKRNFDVQEEDLASLFQQIENPEYLENIERFFKGYEIEDVFSFIHGALPWVSLVHKLDQNQLPPISKKKLQVPDYLSIFEGTKEDSYPVLVEVKSVKKEKSTLELMNTQIASLDNYSKIVGIPLIIAVFWRKYGIWTYLPLGVFEKKSKKHKVKFEDAYDSDLALIFGDLKYELNPPIYRKTVYGETDKLSPSHKKYGKVIQDSLSSYDMKYFTVNPIESAIVDSLCKMEVINETRDGDKLIVVEQSTCSTKIKLSTWILRLLAIFNKEPEPEDTDISRRLIIELMKKIQASVVYSIPAVADNIADQLYTEAFQNTELMIDYMLVHKTDHTKEIDKDEE